VIAGLSEDAPATQGARNAKAARKNAARFLRKPAAM